MALFRDSIERPTRICPRAENVAQKVIRFIWRGEAPDYYRLPALADQPELAHQFRNCWHPAAGSPRENTRSILLPRTTPRTEPDRTECRLHMSWISARKAVVTLPRTGVAVPLAIRTTNSQRGRNTAQI